MHWRSRASKVSKAVSSRKPNRTPHLWIWGSGKRGTTCRCWKVMKVSSSPFGKRGNRSRRPTGNTRLMAVAVCTTLSSKFQSRRLFAQKICWLVLTRCRNNLTPTCLTPVRMKILTNWALKMTRRTLMGMMSGCQPAPSHRGRSLLLLWLTNQSWMKVYVKILTIKILIWLF